MTPEEYEAQDAAGLAGLVRAGEVTASELLDLALSRLDAVQPKINAVNLRLEDQARAAIAAGLPEGPLTGVPFLIKDVSATMAGVRTQAGSRLFADLPPAQADSALVGAYRRAGLAIFGKSNTPEFGLSPVTEPVAFGPTRNPWDPARTSGGSSGGAAAAVAAGVVPAAHASDGGGSIRIPAACCGLVGLKPSRGRVTMAPMGEGWGGLSIQHVVSRTVRDTALLLDVGAWPDPGDPILLPPPATSFVEATAREPRRLRVAVFAGSLVGTPMDPEVAQATRETAALLDSLGHEVEEAQPDMDFIPGLTGASNLVSASLATTLEQEARRRGRPIEPHEVERLTWMVAELGRAQSAIQVTEARQAVHALGRAMAGFFARFDVFVLPTLGSLPVPVGHLDTMADNFDDYPEKLYGFMPNTQVFNATGQPAISLPLGWSASGLPIGVQFSARQGEDALLLRLAAQLEQAAPWRHRRPPVS